MTDPAPPTRRHALSLAPTLHAEGPRLVPAAVAVICGAEAVLVFGSVALGAVLHSLTLVLLAILQARRAEHLEGRPLAVLTLVPLLRLLSLAAVVPTLPSTAWVAIIGVAMLIACIIAIRALGLSRATVGLGRTGWWLQGLIALTGIPAGLGFWRWAAPAPLGVGASVPELVVITLVVALGIGFVEELVFRGVIQGGLTDAYAAGGVAMTTIVFTAAYLGTLSLPMVASMALVGTVYGVITRVTGSILGVAISHAALAVGALIVWPRVLG